MHVNIEEIQDVFHFYDTQGDGKIAASQIPTALRAMMLIPSEALVERMMKQWEKKQNNRITVEEFLPIFKNVAKECGRAPNIREFQALLGHFDREGTGHITLVELRTMLQNSGEKMTVHEVDQLIYGVEMVDGKINIGDFLKNHLQMEG